MRGVSGAFPHTAKFCSLRLGRGRGARDKGQGWAREAGRGQESRGSTGRAAGRGRGAELHISSSCEQVGGRKKASISSRIEHNVSNLREGVKLE